MLSIFLKECYNAPMLNWLRKKIPQTHPLRLMYHRFIAMCAAFYYGFPGNNLTIIGVTGTHGKTTTVNLIAHLLTEAGFKVGMMSSLRFQIADRVWANDAGRSTLGRFRFQEMLREMVRSGCQFAVCEVTSHAVMQSRLWGVNVDIAILTNIAEEHFEYHGTMEAYVAAKKAFFDSLNGAARKPNTPKVLIFNEDDKYFSTFNSAVADRTVSYGVARGTCTAGMITVKTNVTNFELKLPNQSTTVALPLPGLVNVYNTLAAAAVGMVLKINLATMKQAFESMEPLPGRFERIDLGQNYTVVVDYSFTHTTLEQMCQFLKPLTKGRLIVVFGGCGDRPFDQLEKSGTVADKYADLILLTDDDPRNHDRWEILSFVAKGITRKEGDRYWRILDRREATRCALGIAQPGDSVLIAGLGADTIRRIDGQMVFYDDRQVVRELLSKELEVDLAPL